jgi:hypothetical protein
MTTPVATSAFGHPAAAQAAGTDASHAGIPGVLPTARTKPSPQAPLIAFFAAVTLVLLAGIGGRLANFAYLGLAVAAGAAAYARSPRAYVSFALWLWFLTPFVRRVLDYHHGWHPTNPVLLAPPAVALLSALTVLMRLREMRGVLFAPYLLVLVALAYGYAVGVINAGVVPATYALVTWLAPAVFGLHIAVSWRRYPELAATVRRTFAFALPILAAYGIYQFVRMPPWDAAWMSNSGLRSIGLPAPFLARIFGTLNTPGPYAAFLAAGALLLLPQRGGWRYVSIALAMVSLLLSRTRAVWAAFVIGLLAQFMGQPIVRVPRRLVTLLVVGMLALPLAATPRVRNVVLPRLVSVLNIRQDRSFVNRVDFNAASAYYIVQAAEGYGLGMTGGAIKLRGMRGVRSLDNGVLEVFFIFGWPGGLLFFLGVGGLLLQSFRYLETRRDAFANSMRAIAVALVAILPIGDVFTGPTGVLLWMAIGFGIAGHAYHLTTGLALRSRVAPVADRRLVPVTTPPPPLVAPVPAGAGPAAG